MTADPRTLAAQVDTIVVPLYAAWLKANPPCPTCGGKRDTWGETGLYDPCPDCADGVSPFDKWTVGLVALWTEVHDPDNGPLLFTASLRQIGTGRRHR